MLHFRRQSMYPKQAAKSKLLRSIEFYFLSVDQFFQLRKDVTKDLYGGDRTRAMKLLARQREGKRKLKDRALVKIPKAVFRTL